MRINLNNAPSSLLADNNPQEGDIYSKGGGTPGFWWVISVSQNGDVYVLAIDLTGKVTGAQRYGRSYFAERDHRRVGRADIPEINVEWFLKEFIRDIIL